MNGKNRNLWRAVKNHIGDGHKLRIEHHRLDSDKLQLYCLYCGHAVLFGHPSVVNAIAESAIEHGATVHKWNPVHSSIRVH